MFGSYKTFFRNGNIKEEGIVFENKWDSPFSNYYENGSLREKRKHKKGILDVKHYFIILMVKLRKVNYILMENSKEIVSTSTIRGSFGLKANIKMEN